MEEPQTVVAIMKILVLGGHGFIGKQVMEELKGKQAVSLSRRTGHNFLQYESILKGLQDHDPACIINCAAHVGSLHYVSEFAADVFSENVQMALHLYRSVKEYNPAIKIITPLSNCSYPGNAVLHREEEYWNGPVHSSVWSFGNSRRFISVLADCYQKQFQIRSVNFLVPNAYGPGDYTDPNKTHALNGMIIRMIQAIREDKPSFEIWGSGYPQREWIYCKDLARILVRAVSAAITQPINIAQNTSYSIRQTAELIQKHLDYKGKLVFNTRYQDGAPIKQLDNSLFQQTFPDFQFTPLDTGIQDTVQYYQALL